MMSKLTNIYNIFSSPAGANSLYQQQQPENTQNKKKPHGEIGPARGRGWWLLEQRAYTAPSSAFSVVAVRKDGAVSPAMMTTKTMGSCLSSGTGTRTDAAYSSLQRRDDEEDLRSMQMSTSSATATRLVLGRRARGIRGTASACATRSDACPRPCPSGLNLYRKHDTFSVFLNSLISR
jgi:hypothetical protein